MKTLLFLLLIYFLRSLIFLSCGKKQFRRKTINVKLNLERKSHIKKNISSSMFFPPEHFYQRVFTDEKNKALKNIMSSLVPSGLPYSVYQLHRSLKLQLSDFSSSAFLTMCPTLCIIHFPSSSALLCI